MNSIQPQLWIDRAGEAVSFYERAFGAKVVHLVGDGDNIVAQLAVGDALFWVAAADDDMNRFTPAAIGGATARFLLVVDDPAAVADAATAAGALLTSRVHEEHGWRLGRLRDPFGHEWEIGHPVGAWPPE
jgi:PhnB protein